MNIREMQNHVHKCAVDHGWWDSDRSIGEAIALCHSELSEALEESRSGRLEEYRKGLADTYELDKPEGMVVELADCVIRIMDLCEHLGVDLQMAIEHKHAFNINRPYKHGRSF